MPTHAHLFALPKLDNRSDEVVRRIERHLSHIQWTTEHAPVATEHLLEHLFKESRPAELRIIKENDAFRYSIKHPILSVGAMPALLFWFERYTDNGEMAHEAQPVDGDDLTRLVQNIRTILAARLSSLSHDLLPVARRVVGLVDAYDAAYYEQLEVALDMLETIFDDGLLVDHQLVFQARWQAPSPGGALNSEQDGER